MATTLEILYGSLITITGPRNEPDIIHARINCSVGGENYAIHPELFSSDPVSIQAYFPNTLKLQLEFYFAGNDTSAEDGIKFGLWLGEMAKMAKAMKFSRPCQIYMAVTDKNYPYCSRTAYYVALGKKADLSDDPATTIICHKGSLVMVGQTNVA
ncbi:uncharacterized protein RCC_08726 [Ramularia collo-cygni]|uniref:Uncharacterized protein n=1 Tax=Ramularia collo-cygni TaxID=112498 RepID=A0A2D3V0V3_9PEZI|nr:uncharacterized protein RCC_08726 [Ramularia collo-cygni]CZT23016.1 uncharacterized protein RCC_08726 [Ramularia collo-cygni]